MGVILMANKHPNMENLKPQNTRTPEERKIIASMGGKAKIKKDRQLRTWKEIANIMLSTSASDKNKELLKKYNMIGDDADINAMIIYNLITQALKGDINAIKELKEITGNKEAETININNIGTVANDIGEYVNANGKSKKHN